MVSAGNRPGSFDDFGDDEKLVRFVRRVAQRFLGGEPIARLVFAKHVEHRHGVGGRFDVADVDFAQFLGVFQNVGQLFLKKMRFFVRSNSAGPVSTRSQHRDRMLWP